MTTEESGRLRAWKGRALRLEVPLTIYLELTHTCTWRCRFCANRQQADPAPMNHDEWADVLDEARELGCLTVVLTGGEPLAHPSFFDIARHARSLHLALKVYTNGSLVKDRSAASLAELQPLAVELSLHGATSATHDAATQTPGSFGSLRRAVELLLACGVRTVLKTPMTALNEDEIGAITELAARWGVPLVVDPMLTPRDDGSLGPLQLSPSPGAVARWFDRMAAAGGLTSPRRQPGGTNCGLGRTTLAIGPSGEVYPCIQWKHETLGNVRTESLTNIWRGSAMRRRLAEMAEQVNTELLEHGGPASRHPYCPALAARTTGDPLVPDAVFRAHAELAENARGRQ
jgi:MoaA/NifB/PqqE/SkfB family radical SAM enzyme